MVSDSDQLSDDVQISILKNWPLWLVLWSRVTYVNVCLCVCVCLTVKPCAIIMTLKSNAALYHDTILLGKATEKLGIVILLVCYFPMLIETIQNILIFLLKSAAIANEWSERGFFERIQVFKWALCVGTRCLSCMQKEQADCRTNEGPGLLVAPRIELIEQTIILPFSAHYADVFWRQRSGWLRLIKSTRSLI